MPRRGAMPLTNANYPSDLANLVAALRLGGVAPSDPDKNDPGTSSALMRRGRLVAGIAAIAVLGGLFAGWMNEEIRYDAICIFTSEPVLYGC